MPRLPRIYIQTKFFHIMVQGINKDFIFDEEQDIKYYIKLIYELKDDYNIEIVAYCIMNNHAHILIKTEDIKELSKYMQRINIKYSMYYNKKYNRIGYVFRDRYKAQGIYTEEHLYNCIKYIFDNPVKAGMCSRPEEYPYSNYKYVKRPQNIQTDGGYPFVDTKEDIEIYCEDTINEILAIDNMKKEELVDNKIVLKQMIKTLKNEYNYSLRKIAEKLEINRETIRKIYME